MFEKDDVCAPNNNNGTCFPLEEVREIIKIYNSYVAEHGGKPILISSDAKGMMEALRSKIDCSDDSCVAGDPRLAQIKEKLMEYLKPPIPKKWLENKNEWASTLDIDKVLEQYQNKHPDFKYLGAVPIDFDKKIAPDMCVSNDYCNLDMEKHWRDGYKKIGMVFNLDPHDAPGSHWVSLFVDGTNGGIYYFDSVGTYPPQEVVTLMNRISGQLNKCLCNQTISKDDFSDLHSVPLQCVHPAKVGDTHIQLGDTRWLNKNSVIYIGDKPYSVSSVKDDSVELHDPLALPLEKGDTVLEKCWRPFYNDVQHQTQNTECGIYSIFFISKLLEGVPFTQFLGKRISDSEMENYRNIFFRPRNKKIDNDLKL